MALSPDHSGPPLAAIPSFGVRTFLSPSKLEERSFDPLRRHRAVATRSAAVQLLRKLLFHVLEVLLLLLFELMGALLGGL